MFRNSKNKVYTSCVCSASAAVCVDASEFTYVGCAFVITVPIALRSTAKQSKSFLCSVQCLCNAIRNQQYLKFARLCQKEMS